MAQQLVALETRLTYLEDTLQILDGVVIHQQDEMDGLKRQVARLTEQLKSISPSQLEMQANEPPPPHY
jgi:SlyX protein